MDRLTHKLDKWDRYKQQATSSWSVATSISTSSIDKYDPDQLKEDILNAKQRVCTYYWLSDNKLQYKLTFCFTVQIPRDIIVLAVLKQVAA